MIQSHKKFGVRFYGADALDRIEEVMSEAKNRGHNFTTIIGTSEVSVNMFLSPQHMPIFEVQFVFDTEADRDKMFNDQELFAYYEARSFPAGIECEAVKTRVGDEVYAVN